MSPGHTDSKWLNWDSNPGGLSLEALLSTISLCTYMSTEISEDLSLGYTDWFIDVICAIILASCLTRLF